MIVCRHGEWHSAKVGDEFVMMSVEEGNYISLNDVAARVWELIDVPLGLEDLCARLEREFDVKPDVCRTEVEGFINELVTYGAVALDPPQAL